MESQSQNRPIAGILWMLATGLSFVAVTGTVRHLGTALPSAEAAFLRFVIGLVFLLPALIVALRAGLPEGTPRLILGRGVLHVIAVILWFYAMARLPVAEVTAIGYLNPIVVTVGAAVFLGEKLAFRRIAAIVVALIGALVILRPGVREISDGQLAQLGAATCFGLSYLIAKRLSSVMSAGALVALLSLTVTIGLAPFAIAAWVPPTLTQIGQLAIVAAFATLGHYSMARAFAAAPLTVTQPVTFLQLVWATLLGVIAFSEPVDPYILIGGAMIIAAISYMTWREAQVRRRGVTPAAVEAEA
ncbi:MAG TPA: DMT family transporter [Albidovulum sp.]|uniref:DMT family transporter n=1 Tax=Albidovulum sp. TaxID=1872424 RepID=UPI002B6E8851|nr:DMT family transporter [Albidovulum sp.]